MTRSPSTRLAALAAAAVLGGSGLAACSSGGSGSSSSAPSASATSSAQSPSSSASVSSVSSGSSGSSGSESSTATITIEDFKFSGPSRVKPGTKITVKNEDSAAHTVTADEGGAFDVKVNGGKSATFTAPKAGSYPFHCTYHSNMHATLKVS